MTVRALIDRLHVKLLDAYAHVNDERIAKDANGVSYVEIFTKVDSQWQREATDADCEILAQHTAKIAAEILKEG